MLPFLVVDGHRGSVVLDDNPFLQHQRLAIFEADPLEADVAGHLVQRRRVGRRLNFHRQVEKLKHAFEADHGAGEFGLHRG